MIAFEYFAMACVDEAAYESRFDPVREFIKGPSCKHPLQHQSESFLVQRFCSGDYRPTLNIFGENTDGGIEVNMRMFHWLYFRTTFWGFNMNGSPPVYHEELTTRETLAAISLEDAERGEFRVLYDGLLPEAS